MWPGTADETTPGEKTHPDAVLQDGTRLLALAGGKGISIGCQTE